MRALLWLVLAVLLAGCNPYMAAVSLARQTYNISSDMRSLSTQASDTAIEAQIKATIIADPRLTAGQMDVGVYAGHVLLVGVVDRWQKVEDFRENVRSVSGVLSVHSSIQVD
jgi:osmotically-inducible protein OsmY